MQQLHQNGRVAVLANVGPLTRPFDQGRLQRHPHPQACQAVLAQRSAVHLAIIPARGSRKRLGRTHGRSADGHEQQQLGRQCRRDPPLFHLHDPGSTSAWLSGNPSYNTKPAPALSRAWWRGQGLRQCTPVASHGQCHGQQHGEQSVRSRSPAIRSTCHGCEQPVDREDPGHWGAALGATLGSPTSQRALCCG